MVMVQGDAEGERKERAAWGPQGRAARGLICAVSQRHPLDSCKVDGLALANRCAC